MPRLFFDTSALVNRYYEEEGSEVADQLVEAEDNEIVITSLSVVETASAVRRKQNRGELSGEQVDRLLSVFFEEALDAFVSFRWTSPSRERDSIWSSGTVSGLSTAPSWPPHCP
jgi:predicted nucleic acid-binding protein